MLSIVIPTLNEENYLPRLLNCLKKQKFKDYEIIVADADSKDKTIEIAKSFGAKVVKGGEIPYARNQAIKFAQGELILSLDADLILPDDFLENALKEFEKRNLDVATFCLIPISKKMIPKIFFNIFYNYPLRFFEKRWVHGTQGILIKKSIHEKINGWDEKIVLVEDHDYVKRASKIGEFGVIKTTKIFNSLRRFRTEGGLFILFKYIVAEFCFQFKLPLRKNFFNYKFNYFKDGNP
jgi:glycosyltransferase involved in cell wall biosynthesis